MSKKVIEYVARKAESRRKFMASAIAAFRWTETPGGEGPAPRSDENICKWLGLEPDQLSSFALCKRVAPEDEANIAIIAKKFGIEPAKLKTFLNGALGRELGKPDLELEEDYMETEPLRRADCPTCGQELEIRSADDSGLYYQGTGRVELYCNHCQQGYVYNY